MLGVEICSTAASRSELLHAITMQLVHVVDSGRYSVVWEGREDNMVWLVGHCRIARLHLLAVTEGATHVHHQRATPYRPCWPQLQRWQDFVFYHKEIRSSESLLSRSPTPGKLKCGRVPHQQARPEAESLIGEGQARPKRRRDSYCCHSHC